MASFVAASRASLIKAGITNSSSDHRVHRWVFSRQPGGTAYDYLISHLCSIHEENTTGEIEVLEVQTVRVFHVPNLSPASLNQEPKSVDDKNEYQKLKSCCSTRSPESCHSAGSSSEEEDDVILQASTICASAILEICHPGDLPSCRSPITNSHNGDMPSCKSPITKSHHGAIPPLPPIRKKSFSCATPPTNTSGMARHYSDKPLLPHPAQVALTIQHIEDQIIQCRHQLAYLVGNGKSGSASEYLKLCDELTFLCCEVLDMCCRRHVHGAMDVFDELGIILDEVVKSMDVHCGATIAAFPKPMLTSQHDEDSKPSIGCSSYVCILYQCFAGVGAAFKKVQP